MKRFLIRATACLLVIIAVFGINNTQYSCAEVQKNVFRLHILANSNSFEDQRVKYAVRNALLILEKQIFADVPISSASEAKKVLMDNAGAMQQAIDAVLKANSKEYSAQMYVGVYDFPDRTYNGNFFEAGEYDALRVILGNGDGQNWWCVMFPPLCITGDGTGQNYRNDRGAAQQEAKSLFADLYHWVVGVFKRD